MSSIDFAAVRRQVSTLHYLLKMGWESKRCFGDWERGWCPLHSSSLSRSDCFHVNVKSQQWFCHKCKVGGSVLDLACRLTRLDLAGAARQVCETMGLPVPFVQLDQRRRRPRNRARGRVGGRGGAAHSINARTDAQHPPGLDNRPREG